MLKWSTYSRMGCREFLMQGPIHSGRLGKGERSQGERSRYFYHRRWFFPVAFANLVNVLYAIDLRRILVSTPIEDMEVFHSFDRISLLLFSILPFSDSYYARLEAAYSNSAPVFLVVHCHAFILITSGLLMLLMLVRLRGFTRYLEDARMRAHKDLSWSHYYNGSRMLFMALTALGMVIVSTTATNVVDPGLLTDGLLISAVSTPLLVYWVMCTVFLFYLSRKERRLTAK